MSDTKLGRPLIWSQELADKVCELISEGWSLRRVCRQDDMPGLTTVFKWLRENETFAKQYARATEERAEAQHEDLADIGDEAIVAADAADPKASNAIVSAYKLKADNLKWSMSKMKPKRYGEKLDVTSDGKSIQGNTIVFKDFSKPKIQDDAPGSQS